MSLLMDVHRAGLTPIRRMLFNDVADHGITGDTALLENVILGETEGSFWVSIRPDLMRVPARSTAMFMGVLDVAGRVMDLHREMLTIHLGSGQDMLAWISLYMAKAYQDSPVYRGWLGLVTAADYLGWNPLMEESVYPVSLDDSDPTKIGVQSLLGPILLDGSFSLPHHMDPYSTVSFPEAGKIIPGDVLDDIDARDAHRVDDDGVVSVDILGYSNPTSVSRVVRDILTHHLPETPSGLVYSLPENYQPLEQSMDTLVPKWSRMGGNLLRSVDWEKHARD